MTRFVIASAALIAAGSAHASVYTYFGSEIVQSLGKAKYDGGGIDGQFYQEAGLDHAIDQSSFSVWPFPNGTEGLYINGGGNTMLKISRSDGEDFGNLEMEVLDGWGNGGKHIWALAYLDGVLQGQWTIDKDGNIPVGFGGVFDELRIAAYFSAETRNDAYNAQNQNAFQAIAIDNTNYAAVPAPAGAAVLGLGGLAAARRRR